MNIDRTPPLGIDRCDICGKALPPRLFRREPHAHPECAAGDLPAAVQMDLF